MEFDLFGRRRSSDWVKGTGPSKGTSGWMAGARIAQIAGLTPISFFDLVFWRKRCGRSSMTLSSTTPSSIGRFVPSEYFGYLRRNPDDANETTLDYTGYDFGWQKLNQFKGDFINSEMVKAFLSSNEYRQRFGP